MHRRHEHGYERHAAGAEGKSTGRPGSGSQLPGTTGFKSKIPGPQGSHDGNSPGHGQSAGGRTAEDRRDRQPGETDAGAVPERPYGNPADGSAESENRQR